MVRVGHKSSGNTPLQYRHSLWSVHYSAVYITASILAPFNYGSVIVWDKSMSWKYKMHYCHTLCSALFGCIHYCKHYFRSYLHPLITDPSLYVVKVHPGSTGLPHRHSLWSVHRTPFRRIHYCKHHFRSYLHPLIIDLSLACGKGTVKICMSWKYRMQYCHSL